MWWFHIPTQTIGFASTCNHPDHVYVVALLGWGEGRTWALQRWNLADTQVLLADPLNQWLPWRFPRVLRTQGPPGGEPQVAEFDAI